MHRIKTMSRAPISGPCKWQHMTYDQSTEVEFRLVFFPLQMFCFSALCGPNEQKFGELLTWPKVISPPPQIFPNLSIESAWETQHLKGKKFKPQSPSFTSHLIIIVLVLPCCRGGSVVVVSGMRLVRLVLRVLAVTRGSEGTRLTYRTSLFLSFLVFVFPRCGWGRALCKETNTRC